MWKKLRWYLHVARMVPVAAAVTLDKRFGKKRVLAVLAAVVLVIVIIVAVAVLAGRGGGAEAASPSPSPTLSPSPTPEPSPTPSPTVSITMSFAGDCTLGVDDSFGYTGTFAEVYDQQGPDYFLKNVKDIFAADDFTMVNLEGPLTTGGQRADKTWAFHGDPSYVSILTSGSVEAVNLANNHVMDYGDEGYADTVSALEGANILYVGDGETQIVEVQGVKVGLTGIYAVYEDEAHAVHLRENIQTLRDQGAQLIIVTFHWGFEQDYSPEADQVELAHLAVDLGADLVVGHHSHVLQPIERYQGKYIVYSLGNFCFGGNSDPSDYDTMIFQQTFTLVDGQVQMDDNVLAIPCSLSSSASRNDFCPTPATGSEKNRIWEWLKGLTVECGYDPITTIDIPPDDAEPEPEPETEPEAEASAPDTSEAEPDAGEPDTSDGGQDAGEPEPDVSPTVTEAEEGN